MADVRGQEFAKRALVVAAAGGHNVIMLGSPGSGKTMLARRLPTILPPLTPDESLDTTRIYSAVGKLGPGESLLCVRPFRSPHHTISDAGMVGGGTVPRPGEISLAHHGVLSRPGDGTASATMRAQVYAARAVQAKRFGDKAGGLNGRMNSKQIREFCALDASGRATLKEAMEGLGLSARAHDRILRVARTVADLGGSDPITQDHVAEAIGFRALDRKLWEQ